ncbi:MAG: DUF2787 family protein [Verrucomicrobiota bacterium]|nr:DUF2787 family protein [Verrucomicrobiota bacterium]
MQRKHITIKISDFDVSSELSKLLLKELPEEKNNSPWRLAVLNFRDSSYSPQTGGYHPVEIAVTDKGVINYITDFSYRGTAGYEELAKEIDFDFSCGEFQMFGKVMPITEGKELFPTWQKNFCTYYKWGVFNITKEVM